MNKKTDVEVIINGKRYNLSGYESEEYLQQIASYLNSKYAALKDQPGYRNLDMDMKIVLMQINLADDFFKEKQQGKELTRESEDKDQQIFELKHDVIAHQTREEEMQAELERLKEQLIEKEKDIVRLETELSGYRKKGKYHG